MTTFERIKKVANERGYSLKKLAIDAGFSENALYRYNQGVEPKYSITDLDTAINILKNHPYYTLVNGYQRALEETGHQEHFREGISLELLEKFLQVDEFNQLLKYIETNDKLIKWNTSFMIYLIALSGLRAGEALALTRDDVDIDAHNISVTKTKQRSGESTTPKTKSSIRTIAMPDRFFHKKGAPIQLRISAPFLANTG